MFKRKNLNESDEEKEEEISKSKFKKNIDEERNIIKLSKNSKNKGKEDNNLFFGKKSNDPQELIQFLKDENQKLKNGNLEKDKIIQKLTKENSDLKKIFL